MRNSCFRKMGLLCLISILFFGFLVSCDSSPKNLTENLTDEQAEAVINELFSSGVFGNMTNFASRDSDAMGDGVNDFCSISPEIIRNVKTDTEYYPSGYVKKIEVTGEMVSTGKPYHSIVVFSEECQWEIASTPIPLKVTLRVEKEYVQFGGIAEQESSYTLVLNYALLEQLADYLYPQTESIEEYKSFLENNKKTIERISKKAVSLDINFSRVVINGVSYDPKPLSKYLSENYFSYFLDQMIKTYLLSFNFD